MHTEVNMTFGNTELQLSINFKALLIFLANKQFSGASYRTQQRGITDDKGICTNLLYFLPPQFSIFCGWQ